jgi:enoyl-CoA hydratase/carnithine racemase
VSFETIEFAVSADIAHITLARPEKHNAFSVRMRDELFEVLSSCAADTSLRALVVSGSGRSFCAGADLTEFETYPTPFEAHRIRFERDVWKSFDDLAVPTIGCAQGAVIGSGLELLALCDVRIADRGARFEMPEAKLGLVSTACGTQLLPRIVGSQVAQQVLQGIRGWDAFDALAAGFLHRVTPDGGSLAEGVALAAELAELEPSVVRHILLSIRSDRHFSASAAERAEVARAELVVMAEVGS